MFLVVHLWGLRIFFILRTFFGVYSKNGEMNILKIFHFEKFVLSNLLSEPPISTADEKFQRVKKFPHDTIGIGNVTT